jgi:hypothetical protein
MKPDEKNAPAEPAAEASLENALADPKTNRPAEEWKASGIMLEAALRYAARGIPVFPCNARKMPKVKGGFHAATADPEQIKRWWGEWPDALIGMPTGPASGIAVLDLDRKKGKNGFAAVPDWEQRSHVRVRTGSGGAHLYFNADGAPHCTSDVIARGVDTKGHGGYVIVPPSPGYTWNDGDDFTNLPPWPDDLRPPERNPNPTPGVDPEADSALVAAALAVIPNDDLGWDDWNRIGMAAWRATRGSEEGFRAFDTWSRKSAKYKSHKTRKRWDEYFKSPPTQIGAGTLFFLANASSPGWDDGYYAEFEAAIAQANRDPTVLAAVLARIEANAPEPNDEPTLNADPKSNDEPKASDGAQGDPGKEPDTDEKPTGGDGPKAGAGTQGTAGSSASNATGTRASAQNAGPPIHWHGEQSDAQSIPWLIKGLLKETGVSLLAGPWGAAKTFVALDLAGSIITRQERFIDYRIRRHGGVLFVAAESAASIRLRLEAVIGKKLGHAPTDENPPQAFAWVDCQPNLLTDREFKLAKIAKAASAEMRERFGVDLVLIIIDTVAAAAGFTDENDAAQAQTVMNALWDLSLKTKTAVIGIDHFGKDITTGTRGSSAKEGSADAVLACVGERDSVTNKMKDLRMVVRKGRDGESGRVIPLRLGVIDYGVDEDGEAVTTCVVHWEPDRPLPNRGAGRPSRASPAFDRALTRALREHAEPRHLFDGHEVQVVKEDVVRDEFKRVSIEMNDDPDLTAETLRSRWRRARKDALDQGKVKAQTFEELGNCFYEPPF